MRSKTKRNAIVGVVLGALSMVVVVSVVTHGFFPQSVQPITSNLPIIVMRVDSSTPVNIDQMDEYDVPIWMDIIGSKGDQNTFQMPFDPNSVTERYKVGLHLRGQSSKRNPKKPYAVKMYDYNRTDLKKKEHSLFGMPAQDKYVLYSAYPDPSLIRNQVAFEIYRSMGRYAPRMEFVELFISSTNSTDLYYPQHYHGVYLFSERIHRGKHWVDVKEMDEDDDSGSKITGGYILKVDKGIEDINPSSYFTTQFANYTVTEPSDEIFTPAKMKYISEYIQNVEWALMSDNHTTVGGVHYSELIDEISFADMFIIQELSKNVDAYRLSQYLYKDRKKKLCAGPVWDLDRTFGNELFDLDTTDGWVYNDRSVPDLEAIPDYWVALLADPNFQMKLKARWQELRSGPLATDKVLALIETHRDALQSQDAAYRDYNRWGPWYFPFEFWVTEDFNSHHISLMSRWVKARLQWMDSTISAFPSLS